MVERSEGKRINLSFFENRKTFMRDAIQAGAHKSDPGPLDVPKNEWTCLKNILGIYYFTGASEREIAGAYSMPVNEVLSIAYRGTLLMFYNSPIELRAKYIFRWRGGKPTMLLEKPKLIKSTVSEPQEVPSSNGHAQNAVEHSSKKSPKKRRGRKPKSIQESLAQFANDLDMWNLAKTQGLLGKLNARTNVDALEKYFERNGETPSDPDLEDLSVVVAKYGK